MKFFLFSVYFDGSSSSSTFFLDFFSSLGAASAFFFFSSSLLFFLASFSLYLILFLSSLLKIRLACFCGKNLLLRNHLSCCLVKLQIRLLRFGSCCLCCFGFFYDWFLGVFDHSDKRLAQCFVATTYFVRQFLSLYSH